MDPPLGGFLAAATQPLLPAHLLAEVPLTDLANDLFGTGADRVRAVPARHAAGRTGRSSSRPPGAEPSADPSPTAGPHRLPRHARARRSTRTALVPSLERIEIRFFDDAEALDRGLPRRRPPGGVAGCRPRWPARSRPTTQAVAAALSDDDAGGDPARPPAERPGAARSARPASAARRARSRRADHRAAGRRRAARGRAGPARRRGRSTPRARSPSRSTRRPRRSSSRTPAGSRSTARGARRGATAAFAIEVLAPTAAANPPVNALAVIGRRSRGRRSASARGSWRPTPRTLATRLRQGRFTAAVVDIAFTLDPDLYPLLASTQATSRGGEPLGPPGRASSTRCWRRRGSPGRRLARQAAYRDAAGLSRDLAADPAAGLAGRDGGLERGRRTASRGSSAGPGIGMPMC